MPQPSPDVVAALDQRVIEHANTRSWTYDQLFGWANSKHGRWLGDTAFGRTTAELPARWDVAVRGGLLELPEED